MVFTFDSFVLLLLFILVFSSSLIRVLCFFNNVSLFLLSFLSFVLLFVVVGLVFHICVSVESYRCSAEHARMYVSCKCMMVKDQQEHAAVKSKFQYICVFTLLCVASALCCVRAH